ncbi:SagB family peptide dehydrogenase [Micromonospora endolithica]|uniref:SagB/ThcOx family dehydrogenase n=1 Tax=Micromonospora endolithica TaxID=230091 RepID=A0A3A9ZKJ4_9ACTN|nr:SagB family peptide dehydrogenase [Micromonospora endolithica]RKN47816.1 SagB/ThcOx family dehydrogenase [Micromonospora endolithica]TWJ21499.1 SagB-type dehydrogenase family enzyme [Micromonospora endolithica]
MTGVVVAPLWTGFDLGPAPGVRVTPGPGPTLTRGRETVALPTVAAGAWRDLAYGRLTATALREATRGRPADRIAATVALDVLDAGGWLSYHAGGDPPALVAWRRGTATLPPPPADPAAETFGLSRFCHVVARDGDLLATAPAYGFDVAVRDHRLWRILSLLARPRRPAELTDADDGDLLAAAWPLLLATGVVVATGVEDRPPLRYWEPADLLAHGESREGLRRKPFGGTYRFAEPQPEPVRPPSTDQRVDLPSPAPGALPEGHLFRVLAERRSVRRGGAEPITLGQLGEFLHRCARTTAEYHTDHGVVRTRPYPSGGAIHELDLTLVVHRVAGLDPGGYAYRPAEHRLDRLPAAGAPERRLLDDAAVSTMRTAPPDVLVLIGADLPRLAWKYEGIAYALVLKHVGVLMQTMYLVATAMRLAPCAVGGGDAAQAALLTRLDPFARPVVGEFILGSGPDDDTDPTE